MPEPDPVALYVNAIPFFSWKASPRALITFDIEVEPSVETDVVSFFPQEANAVSASTDASATAIIFFI